MSFIKKIGLGVGRLIILIVFVLAVVLMKMTLTNGSGPDSGSYFLAGIALLTAIIGLKYFAQPRLREGPAWVRRTNLLASLFVLTGLLALILGHSTIGQIILYPSLIALAMSFFRVDMMLHNMRTEAVVDISRRLAFGGGGFAAVYVFALFSNDRFFSLKVFLFAFCVMAMIIGFMTIRSRIADHERYFLMWAGKEPPPIKELPGEMIYQSAVYDHQSVKGFLRILFYLYFLIVVFIAGIIAIPFYAYLLARGVAATATSGSESSDT
ncbi:MAG: hypothetical protein K0U72_13415 [Gammaproteobacteria bacterium]|nr:hypothetical protein [Gammaproteobacteria bacterium]